MYQYSLLIGCLFIVQLAFSQALTPYFHYTVTPNDKSLWSISQKHNVSLEDLKVLNQKEDDAVNVGEVIKIPKEAKEGLTYHTHVVTKQDKNLWRICKKYKVAVPDVMELNNKSTKWIRVGEQLKIPLNGRYIVHTVSETDKSLWGICRIYGVDVNDVLENNDKSSTVIRRGDQLIIPKDYQHISASGTSTETVPSINSQSTPTKPVFDFANNQWRFPYHNRKKLHIFPSIKTGFSNYYTIDPVEYGAFFQDYADYSPNQEHKTRYFYSVEKPIVQIIRDDQSHYVSEADQAIINAPNGYSYDVITIIEVDSINNSFKILPVFLYKNSFGDVQDVPTGTFACCLDPFPLASYSKDEKQELVSHSTFLTPSIIKYTEVTRHLKEAQVVSVDSTTLILQLKTDAIPSLIDSEEYINGRRTTRFSNVKRRQELNY